jgi:hypothetical protein
MTDGGGEEMGGGVNVGGGGEAVGVRGGDTLTTGSGDGGTSAGGAAVLGGAAAGGGIRGKPPTTVTHTGVWFWHAQTKVDSSQFAGICMFVCMLSLGEAVCMPARGRSRKGGMAQSKHQGRYPPPGSRPFGKSRPHGTQSQFGSRR